MNPLYAGYINYPAWGIDWVKAKHESLISLETYEKIQDKLGSKYRATIKDTSEAFPLRGLLHCEVCQKKIRGGWIKGNGGKYAYYFCQNRICPRYWKTVTADKLDEQIIAILKEDSLDKLDVELIETFFEDHVGSYIEGLKKDAQKLKAERTRLDQQIRDSVSTIFECKNKELKDIYEKTLVELRIQKDIVEKKIEMTKLDDTRETMRTALDRVLDFAKNLDKIYTKGDYEQKKNLLKLMFGGYIVLDINGNVRTTNKSEEYQLIKGIDGSKNHNGAPEGTIIEPNKLIKVVIAFDQMIVSMRLDSLCEQANSLPELKSNLHSHPDYNGQSVQAHAR